MTRTDAREIAIHMIFELGFSTQTPQDLFEEYLNKDRFADLGKESKLYKDYPSKKQESYIRGLVEGTFFHGPELDGYISQYAKGWSFARIPRVAAAIMRVSMYEILYMPEIPNASAINDAIDIAKGYESPEVVSFINGILGSFVRAEFSDSAPKPEKKEKATPATPPEAEEDVWEVGRPRVEEPPEEVVEKEPEEATKG